MPIDHAKLTPGDECRLVLSHNGAALPCVYVGREVVRIYKPKTGYQRLDTLAFRTDDRTVLTFEAGGIDWNKSQISLFNT